MAKEAKKVDMARLVLAGQKSFTQKEADVFEGLNPEEIQEFVEKVPSFIAHSMMSPRLSSLISMLRISCQ